MTFTSAQLRARVDADEGACAMACDGFVFDTTTGRDFYGPGGPYAALNGRDATRALATMKIDVSEEDEARGTEGLSEEQQTDLARQMFEDGLYQEAWNTSSCYLQEFRSGKSRENMMFLQARASQQAGSLNQALRDLQKFQKNFPGSRKYQEEVLFRKGVVLARMQQYLSLIHI